MGCRLLCLVRVRRGDMGVDFVSHHDVLGIRQGSMARTIGETKRGIESVS